MKKAIKSKLAYLKALVLLIKGNKEVRVNFAKKSFYFYCAYYFGMYLWPQQVRWANKLRVSKRHLTLAPAGHGKTQLISYLLVIREICFDRNIRILNISASADLAEKNCMLIREELQSNVKLIKDFGAFYSPDPRVVKIWQQTQFQVIRSKRMKDPTVQAKGILSKLTGSRYDLVVFDDIIDVQSAASSEQRKKILKEVNSTIIPRLESWGKAWAVGTRKHHNDIYSYMIKNPMWTFTVDQALIREPEHPDGTIGWRVIELTKPEYDKDGYEVWVKIIIDSKDKGESLCPEIWTVKDLLLHRYLIGTISFNQEYQNIMVDDATAQFKRADLENCLNDNRSYFTIAYKALVGWPVLPNSVREKYKTIIIGIDPSLVTSEKEAAAQESSFMVQVAIGVTDRNKRELIAIDRFRGKSPKDKLERVKRFYYSILPEYAFMEKNSFGSVYISLLVEDDQNLKIVPHHTGRNKKDLYAGVPGLSVLFENKSFDIPNKTEEDKLISEDFINEFHSLGTSEQTDQIMATWIADTGIKRYLTGQARLNKNRRMARGQA